MLFNPSLPLVVRNFNIELDEIMISASRGERSAYPLEGIRKKLPSKSRSSVPPS
jgi:hypothetical protein